MYNKVMFFIYLLNLLLIPCKIINKKYDLNKISIINNLIGKKDEFDINNVQYFINKEEFENKKIISISPGGYFGFYIMGVCTYIKENYNLEDYIFTGASAGAWNSLFMTYKGNAKKISEDFLHIDIKNSKNINEVQKRIKQKILKNYKNEDFDIKKLFTGVTTIKNFNPKVNIYSHFENLEDAINCCIASSHIPIISGPIFNTYRNILTFDGGFCEYPYLNTSKPVLHITPNIWNTNNNNNFIKENIFLEFLKNTKMFYKGKMDLQELYNKGYEDTKKNKTYLDKILDPIF